ncbi:MAG TPA: hypothetical protein VGX92_13270 [Pyrinomonadaceae bacterium]|jgi:hypothetical protein|nr:hypothetical protein [Pyrinomonadaceae bacterium]
MLFLTEDAVIVCLHERGIVQNAPSQDWVTIAGRRVLVEVDPEGRPIKGCPNFGVGIRPCLTTLKVQVGYSDWIRVDGHRVCLDTVTGLTDGTPPGTVMYKVNQAGQPFVEEVL